VLTPGSAAAPAQTERGGACNRRFVAVRGLRLWAAAIAWYSSYLTAALGGALKGVARVTAIVDGQESSHASTIPPVAQLAEMLNGLWLWWMLYVVAERGIADLLADGPQTSVELAQATGLHEPSLYRLLRSLTGFGVFTEESPRRFALTPLSSTLKTGDPSAGRSWS
jgi:IclR helix-turn-helix domain